MDTKGAKKKTLNARSNAPPDDWEGWMDWEQDVKPASASPQDANDAPSSAPSLSPQSPKKRKLSSDSGEKSTPKRTPPPTEGKLVQDRSHSVVEKRYRENLNQKIADLGACIPSLQAEGKASSNHKQNKATVLTEAMAYIQRLEKRNIYLQEANNTLKLQMQQRERKRSPDPTVSDAGNAEIRHEAMEESSTVAEGPTVRHEPKGLIPVPEEMRRLWKDQSQDHYADSIYCNSDETLEETSTGVVHVKGGKYIGRMVVGSLAGFMILDGFVTPHKNVEKRNDRGLSAMPFGHIFSNLRRVLADQYAISLVPSSYILSRLTRAVLVFCVLGLMLFLYLYYSRPPARKPKTSPMPQPAPSLASPLEVRQNAWLTSIQTVWVPRHHIFPEMFALILETAAYLSRLILGRRCYLWLTGRSEADELADIRAWDIALDAQLSGGDPEVSKGRLVLTLWAAGTLPSTPNRLMLKALHLRVLFWQPSHFNSLSRAMHVIAFLLSRYQWNKALKLHENLKKGLDSVRFGGSDPLPDHLDALLNQSAEEVLNDTVIQRTHNFVWNRQNDDTSQTAIDDVTDDSAMRGPLDLIASWFSSSRLQAALQKSLQGRAPVQLICSELDVAVQTAPPRSMISACALAAMEVFQDADRGSYFSKVTWALPSCYPTHIEPPSSVTAIEIQLMVAGHCGLALSKINCGVKVVTGHVSSALRLICQRPVDIGLLSSAVTSHTLYLVFEHVGDRDEQLVDLHKDMAEALVRLQDCKHLERSTVERGAQDALCKALRCSSHSEGGQRRISDASLDAGYGTMSDEETI